MKSKYLVILAALSCVALAGCVSGSKISGKMCYTDPKTGETTCIGQETPPPPPPPPDPPVATASPILPAVPVKPPLEK